MRQGGLGETGLVPTSGCRSFPPAAREVLGCCAGKAARRRCYVGGRGRKRREGASKGGVSGAFVRSRVGVGAAVGVDVELGADRGHSRTARTRTMTPPRSWGSAVRPESGSHTPRTHGESLGQRASFTVCQQPVVGSQPSVDATHGRIAMGVGMADLDDTSDGAVFEIATEDGRLLAPVDGAHTVVVEFGIVSGRPTRREHHAPSERAPRDQVRLMHWNGCNVRYAPWVRGYPTTLVGLMRVGQGCPTFRRPDRSMRRDEVELHGCATSTARRKTPLRPVVSLNYKLRHDRSIEETKRNRACRGLGAEAVCCTGRQPYVHACCASVWTYRRPSWT